MKKSNVNTAIILAGGKSTRMGFNKAFLKIGKKTIIETILDKLKDVFEEIVIVANSPVRYRRLGVKLMPDIIPDRGPLGGIYSGLVKSKGFHNFFFACDTPFINLDLIRYMKGVLRDYDVIIPKVDNKLEPLCAIYSKNCIKPIKRQIERNDLKITDFFKEVKVKYIQGEQIKKFDPEILSFLNVNTKIDFQKAQKILRTLDYDLARLC